MTLDESKLLLNAIESDVNNKNKKAKQLKRRDWYIAGFGAIVGIVGTLIIQLII